MVACKIVWTQNTMQKRVTLYAIKALVILNLNTQFTMLFHNRKLTINLNQCIESTGIQCSGIQWDVNCLIT